MNNVIQFNPILMQFRKMWRDDRWKFSGELVRLTIKESKYGLSSEEQHKMDTLNQVVDENDGKWLEGYEVTGITKNTTRQTP